MPKECQLRQSELTLLSVECRPTLTYPCRHSSCSFTPFLRVPSHLHWINIGFWLNLQIESTLIQQINVDPMLIQHWICKLNQCWWNNVASTLTTWNQNCINVVSQRWFTTTWDWINIVEMLIQRPVPTGFAMHNLIVCDIGNAFATAQWVLDDLLIFLWCWGYTKHGPLIPVKPPMKIEHCYLAWLGFQLDLVKAQFEVKLTKYGAPVQVIQDLLYRRYRADAPSQCPHPISGLLPTETPTRLVYYLLLR